MSDAKRRKNGFTIGYLLGLAGLPLAIAPTKEQIVAPVLAPTGTWFTDFESYNNQKVRYKAIHLVDTYAPTGEEDYVWAADKDKTGSIMCYGTGNELFIAGNGSGRIMANEDSASAFAGFSNVSNISGLNILDTSNATSMSTMFMNCYLLNHLDVSNFDTRNVNSMDSMFHDCRLLTTLDLQSFDTSLVTSMYGMFVSCYGLKTVDLRSFNTSKARDMSHMFNGCSKMEAIYVGSGWVIKPSTVTTWMFRNCGVSSVTYV